ncbi:MAG: hypothetical protein R3F30_12890 [Planctomycetota bacterium]
MTLILGALPRFLEAETPVLSFTLMAGVLLGVLVFVRVFQPGRYLAYGATRDSIGCALRLVAHDLAQPLEEYPT